MFGQAEIHDIFTREFERKKDDPLAWAHVAWNLRVAADALLKAYQQRNDADGEPLKPEHNDLDEPAALLLGYAFENMIKGYLIKRHGGFEATSKLYSGQWNHHLKSLAEKTGLPFCSDQKLLLGSLEAFVKWAGRYPVSLKPGAFPIPSQHNSGNHLPPFVPMPSEIDLLDQFYKQMENDIHGPLRSQMKLPGKA